MAYTSANLPAVNQYDVNKTILEPLFLGQDYMQYMEVMPNVAGTIVLDKFQSLSGITKAFNRFRRKLFIQQDERSVDESRTRLRQC